jgi:hypothetical protein
MNGLTIALLSVLGTMVVAAIAVAAIMAHIQSKKDWEQDRKITGELTAALGAHRECIEKYSSAMQAVPKLVEGLGKLAGAQVVEITELRKQVKSLKDAIFRRDALGVEVPDEREKDFAWRAKEIMEQSPGISMGEALQKVVEEEARGMTSPGGFDLG